MGKNIRESFGYSISSILFNEISAMMKNITIIVYALLLFAACGQPI
ncbi:MAG TPA: hypothetical protein VFN95_01605 [Flavitalea sp.]|nr:hypothetical protein [Flavitalea sp.]